MADGVAAAFACTARSPMGCPWRQQTFLYMYMYPPYVLWIQSVIMNIRLFSLPAPFPFLLQGAASHGSMYTPVQLDNY